MIKSVCGSNSEAIQSITSLYGHIEADFTYSSGKFWNSVGYHPEHKFDICPVTNDTVSADVRSLPLQDESISSSMFDPPFIVAHGKESIIGGRFSSYPNMKTLWGMYDDALVEIYRVTKQDGFMVFKCQDTVSGGRQWWSHVHIITQAAQVGWYTKDLFVLLAKSRMKTHNTTRQQHARKFHSYFIVLQKIKWDNVL